MKTNLITNFIKELRLTPLSAVKWAIPAILLAYTFYPTFVWMVERWESKDSYYGHGFIVPLVTIYWIVQKRKALANFKANTSWVGFSLLALGLAVQVLSYVLRFYFLSGFAFVLILLGLTYFLFGAKVFSKIWFPIAFLLMMVPLPLLIISEITLKMKFFVAEASTYLISTIGIEAVRKGSYIYTPHSILLVGDPCSGLRSLIAFICLGFVFAYDDKLVIWKRVLIVAMGLPLAVISNILRVFFLGLVGEIYGMEHTGPGTAPHDISGIVVFIVAFAAFMILRKKLEQIV